MDETKKEVQVFHGGPYQPVEVVGKYDQRELELPKKYLVVVIDQDGTLRSTQMLLRQFQGR